MKPGETVFAWQYNLILCDMKLLADLGEEMPQEHDLIPLLDMGAVSCGAHAGNESTIRRTIAACVNHGVAVGAHPSFADKAHFGRIAHQLAPAALYQLVTGQLQLFSRWAAAEGAIVTFVKPHGALYNLSADNYEVAHTIALAVRDTDPSLAIVGLAGSVSITAAAEAGLTTMSEAFTDRRYLPTGTLCPRSQPGAVIDNPSEVLSQYRQLCKGYVTDVDNQPLQIGAQVVCIHGDHPEACQIARLLRSALNYPTNG